MNAPAIQTEALRKVYGDKVAVRGITLEVRQGEVFGFLGPNGAGKTTFIKMLLGLTRATSGRASILGVSAANRSVRATVGFLPEHFRFHDWLTAAEFLTLHARLYRMTESQIPSRVDQLLERVGLASFRNQQLRTFSKGMLQRAGLAQALLNHPALVFLDEPTSGLDPVGRLLVRDVIRELRANGTCVFLNSHLLSEVEITCDRVAFIKHGEVLQVHPLKELMEGRTTVAIRCNVNETRLAQIQARLRDARFESQMLRFSVSRESEIPEIVRYLVEQGIEIYSVTPQRLSLEELFVKIVGTDGGL